MRCLVRRPRQGHPVPDMPEFVRLLLAAILGAGLVVAVNWCQRGLKPLSNAVNQTADASRVERTVDASDEPLSERFRALQRSQEQVLGELAQLRAQVERSSGADYAAGDRQPAEGAPEIAVAQRDPDNGLLTPAQLIATGIAEDDAEALVQRLDELALARLEADYAVRQASGDQAQNRAAREERRRIPRDADAIREEFGDSAYERYLYARGQPNRVEVASVLRSSSALAAGVEPGDHLKALDGKPLFSVRDLTARVREGSPGESYALEIERNGETIELWVPGGPLGVRVNAATVPPD